MKIAPFPEEEEKRINNLLSYDILDSEKEKEYDDLVELASQICDCPIAIITFVDNNRQWFKARKKVNDSETSRDIAFCSHTILQEDVMVIEDARNHHKFHGNPLVTGELNIGFYAGAPIISSAGFKLGSVCVIDNTKKNDLSKNQKESLQIIARQVSKLVELRGQNKLILEQSKEKINAEKKVSQLTILESDTKDKRMAYELHENLAQRLTAIKLFLETSEKSKDLRKNLMQKSKDSVTLLIEEVKNLSKSITPTTLKNVDYYSIIQEYAFEFGTLNNIKVKFGKTISILNNSADIGGNLFRIIQRQLEIAMLSDTQKVLIVITNGTNITLEFSYESNNNKSNSLIEPLINNISTRVELLKGTMITKKVFEQNSIIIKINPHQE
jgi:hypothetical protein